MNPESNPQNITQPERVRAMFGSIARRYDFLNHCLSLHIDKRWRRFTVREIAKQMGGHDFEALDLACGTADLTLELRKITCGRVIGMDFCHPMLVVGMEKIARLRGAVTVSLSEADALQLPIRDAGFDVVTIAFGLRNLENYEKGLREMFRVLRPSGVLGVLEFSHPRMPVFRQLYQFYFSSILPRIGAKISGVKGPYRYLPDSVSAFPDPDELKLLMETVGFRPVQYFNLSGGIAVLHVGKKLG